MTRSLEPRLDLQRRLLARGACVFLPLLLLSGTVVLTLRSKPSSEATTPIVPEQIGWATEPVRLIEREARPGRHTHNLQLVAATPVEVLAHPEIRILLATYKQRLDLIGAELRVAGTPCSYATPPGARLLDNRLLRFVRGEECSAIAAPITGALELIVRLRGAGAVAAWTFLPPTGQSDPRWIAVSRPGSQPPGTRPVLRGSYVDHQTPTTMARVDLLNHMWQLSSSTGWLWSLLLCALLLALVGGLVLPLHRLPDPHGKPPLRFLLRGAAGSSCLALALGASYAVLTPPLMAPDEPFHLLGFAALNENRRIAPETENWTRSTHLVRIRFHAWERFRPSDVSAPWSEADPLLYPTTVQTRSSMATTYWRALGRHLQGRSAQFTLIAVRLSNALLFGLAVGVAVAIGIAFGRVSYPQLLWLPFLFVPTLPFFAMHVSDHSVLCAAYILLAGSLGALFLDGPRAHWAGVPIGLGVALMLAGGRSSLPLLAVVTIALAARILLGSRRSTAPARAAAVFWVGFALGASVFYALVDQAQLNALAIRLPAGLSGRSPSWLRWLVGHPPGVIGLAMLAGAGEVAFATVRSRVGSRLGHRASQAVAPLMVALVVAIALSLFGSLVTSYPRVPTIQVAEQAAFVPDAPSMGRYTRQVVGTALTVFRLREPDLYLYSSFFGGFGWLDAVPPAPFLTGLAVLIALAVVLLALQLARAADARRVIWLLALFGGSIVSLTVYAVSCYSMPVNLHGRYLIGWYLCWLAVVFAAVAAPHEAPRHPPGDAGNRRPSFARVSSALLLCGAIHAYCLSFILLRYF